MAHISPVSYTHLDVYKRQLDKVAEHLKLDHNTLEPMRHPKRSLSVVVPARMDDGSVRTFMGYRVHHDLALGPGKGGLRFHEEVTLGQVASMAMLMTWKCSLMNLPFGGAQMCIRDRYFVYPGQSICDHDPRMLSRHRRLFNWWTSGRHHCLRWSWSRWYHPDKWRMAILYGSGRLFGHGLNWLPAYLFGAISQIFALHTCLLYTSPCRALH